VRRRSPNARDDVLMWHPITGGKTTTTRQAFEVVWQPKGWQLLWSLPTGLHSLDGDDPTAYLDDADRDWLRAHGWAG
jgi:hypothetical protein